MPTEIYRTISEQVADRIRRQIMSGDLSEGMDLKEQGLSDRFGVSRGTVRHALMALAREGLVVPTPNVGMRVANHPSGEAMELIVTIRREIEEFALRNSFSVLRERHIEDWWKILENLRLAGEQNDLSAFIDRDIQFHRFLVDHYPDKHVAALWDAVHARMRMRYNRLRSLSAGYEEHRSILVTVEAGDLERAVALLRQNIT